MSAAHSDSLKDGLPAAKGKDEEKAFPMNARGGDGASLEDDRRARNRSHDAAHKSIPIAGRFDQYRSSYWSGWLAIAGARYGLKAVLRPGWDKLTEASSHLQRHQYGIGAGALMYGVAGHYAKTTWQDMKTIFAQPLAWEFDKDPKDIGYRDFVNSKNTVIQQTIENFKTRNIQRFALNTIFFLPALLKGPLTKTPLKAFNHTEIGVDLGIAANAGYLFKDVMTRKASTFETLQHIIDTKINHTEHASDQITSDNLLDIYERHAAKGGIPKFGQKRGTSEWEGATTLFERMAELMNQTHGNTVRKEQADFDMDKFIFLVGNGMIDPNDMARSRAYVEIANRQEGIQEIKNIALGGQKMSLEEMVKTYGLEKQCATPAQEADETPQEAPRRFARAPQRTLRINPPAETSAAYVMQRRTQHAPAELAK